MLILGISGFSHDAAAALFSKGELIAAAQEERFTRIKFDPSFPENSIRYCLDKLGATPNDLDCVAYFELASPKLNRLIAGSADGGPSFRAVSRKSHLLPGPERRIRSTLRYTGALRSYAHHLSHAAHAFGASGFSEAAIIVADAIGEWHTTTIVDADSTGLHEKFAVDFPHSLGLFYSAITAFLGFNINADEYKVMGLAPYGVPCYVDTLSAVLRLHTDGSFQLDPMFFNLNGMIFAPPLSTLLSMEPRTPGSPIDQSHTDLARSAQVLIEMAMLGLARRARLETGKDHLCIGGGVALNCVANDLVRRLAGFQYVSAPPGAGDCGSAIGAARLAHLEMTGNWPGRACFNPYLGPAYDSNAVGKYLSAMKIPCERFADADLVRHVARLLSNGKTVGWFQGEMEFGPRALGGRSILADPRRAMMRDRLNSAIKKRESFRPFAPIALRSCAQTLFVSSDDPFMTFVTKVLSPELIPAAVHVDHTARLQTVDDNGPTRLVALLKAFESETGIACLLNTSFNLADEPIVCSPMDALTCFRESGLDVLVIEDYLIIRSDCPPEALSPGASAYIEYSRERRPFLADTYSFS